MFRKGLLIIISGPSGTGKGSVLSLLKKMQEFRFSVSATTREPRTGEFEGINYFFKTVDEFKEMINNGELIEWDEYCGNFYGTPKKYVEKTINEGIDIILEITVEGAENIKNLYPDCVSVFILPPSFTELKRRIEARATEKPGIIQDRIDAAHKEVCFADKYDYVIINENLENAAKELQSIITSEKLKYDRNKNILKYLEQ
jgi:guanylate kinase